MEPESRVLTRGELIRWSVLAAILGLGIIAFFMYADEAAPFHPVQSPAATEGHR